MWTPLYARCTRSFELLRPLQGNKYVDVWIDHIVTSRPAVTTSIIEHRTSIGRFVPDVLRPPPPPMLSPVRYGLPHAPLVQITIPALFMLLLVWIKTTTSVFDSPAASYSCGQTLPWRHEDHLDPATIEDSPLYQCLQKPDNCRAENYYRDEDGIFEEMGLEDVREM